MAEPRFVFEHVTQLTAIAEGAPGKRTFYLVVGRDGEWVKAWLGKEQLVALGGAIQQILDNLAQTGTDEPVPESPTVAPASTPEAEFQIGRLALGHDARRDYVVIILHRLELDENDPPTLRFSGSPAQMRGLVRRISAVVAAGRPACPLCGGPVDPEGHVCPRSNGHNKTDVEIR